MIKHVLSIPGLAEPISVDLPAQLQEGQPIVLSLDGAPDRHMRVESARLVIHTDPDIDEAWPEVVAFLSEVRTPRQRLLVPGSEPA
jgi:hypothetical protein